MPTIGYGGFHAALCRILEHDDRRWLESGDLVELEIERIGVLRNRVAG